MQVGRASEKENQRGALAPAMATDEVPSSFLVLSEPMGGDVPFPGMPGARVPTPKSVCWKRIQKSKSELFCVCFIALLLFGLYVFHVSRVYSKIYKEEAPTWEEAYHVDAKCKADPDMHNRATLKANCVWASGVMNDTLEHHVFELVWEKELKDHFNWAKTPLQFANDNPAFLYTGLALFLGMWWYTGQNGFKPVLIQYVQTPVAQRYATVKAAKALARDTARPQL